MRLVTILLLLSAVASVSCSKAADEANKPGPTVSPSTSSSSVATPSAVSDAGGESTPKEPGDTSPETFEGTAGITEVKRLDMAPVVLREIRTGQHPAFDRVVFEFEDNRVPGYHVEYVERPVRTCGAGEVVQVEGYGYLLVQLMPAQAHTNDGKPTIKQREIAPNLPLIKQLKILCDFEADVQWILGLSSPNRYRVLELSNPARLVVDVRH